MQPETLACEPCRYWGRMCSAACGNPKLTDEQYATIVEAGRSLRTPAPTQDPATITTGFRTAEQLLAYEAVIAAQPANVVPPTPEEFREWMEGTFGPLKAPRRRDATAVRRRKRTSPETLCGYEVGDTIEYVTGDGRLRRIARVTRKDADTKNGQPGFEGVLVTSLDPSREAVKPGENVWGYEARVTRVVERHAEVKGLTPSVAPPHPTVRQRKPRRAKRPELPRTPRQLVAHAAADGIATTYRKAELIIGVEQVTVWIPGMGVFIVSVSRGDEDDFRHWFDNTEPNDRRWLGRTRGA